MSAFDPRRNPFAICAPVASSLYCPDTQRQPRERMARAQGAHSISRRSFCWTLAGVLVAPGIAIAQDSKAVRRIGVLSPGAPWTSEEIRYRSEALRELGWVEGQNLHVERRYGNHQVEALQPLAEQLVRAKVEVLVVEGY